jgi:HK97 gp10 family phage protein
MANLGNSFKVNPDVIGRIGNSIAKRIQKDDKEMEKRITRATQMVWAIAHQKRPLVSRAMADAYGVKKRVSDPNAQAGVPVDTGVLQASITQKVSRTSNGIQGIIQTKGVPYAKAMEYGTSRIAARSFMRPAINFTKQAIRTMMKLKIDSNL